MIFYRDYKEEKFMNHGKDLLIQGITELKMNISEKQTHQFINYYEMLIEKNKVMNLTAITDQDDVMVKHFIDSLLIVKSVDLMKISSVIDVGTGAGFPGIPIKIMFPHLKIILLDSLNKRLNFLNDVIAKLKFSDIETIHGRAEDFGHKKEYREKFDMCVSRAVANLSTLSEYCIPFIKTGGMFVSYKSSISSEEIAKSDRAINILGGKIISQKTYDLPCSDMERTMVVIEKNFQTPKKYPRKAGIPSKEPIE